MYKYTSKQQQFGTNQKQAISVQATVETLCNSGELHAPCYIVYIIHLFLQLACGQAGTRKAEAVNMKKSIVAATSREQKKRKKDLNQQNSL